MAAGDETLEAMRRVMARRFGVDAATLTPEREIASLGLDSLALIECMFELEDELKVSFPEVPRNLATLGDLAAFVRGEVARKANAAP